MKVRVITDVMVCFEADIPDTEIEAYKNDCNSELFQTAWKEWDKLTENLSLPFEMSAEGCEIFSVVDAKTDETIYQE